MIRTEKQNLIRTLELLREYRVISIPFLQRRLNISYQMASDICQYLLKKGKIDKNQRDNFFEI